MSDSRGRSSISRTVLLYILLFSSFVTLLVTALQLYQYYEEQADLVEQRMNQIELSYGDSLANALWSFDDRQIETILSGIMKFDDVHFVEVQSSDSTGFRQGERRPGEKVRFHEVNVVHRFEDRVNQVGVLRIEANLVNVVQRLGQKFWLILIAQAIKTFFVSIFILFIIYYLITRHLKTLADHTANLSFDQNIQPSPLSLNRRRSNSVPDELDQLVTAFNAMQHQLHDTVSTLRESRQRYKHLFDNAEVSIWNADCSEVIKYIHKLQNEGVENLQQYLADNLETAKDIAHRIKINHVNRTTLRMLGAGSEQKLLDSTSGVFGTESVEAVSRFACAIWDGQSTFRHDATLTTQYGEELHVIVSMPIPDSDEGFQEIPITTLDITERKKAEKHLSYQASHDALTGLINRREFERRAFRLLSTVQSDHSKHAMCFLDLDKFKVVNDTCGHDAGDMLLRQISELLTHTVRKRDTMARLGGDEFGILMEHCQIRHAQRVAFDIVQAIEGYKFKWGDEMYQIGVSIGLIEISEATGSYGDLLKYADVACYMAKESGGNRIQIYRPDDSDLAMRHGEIQWVGRINQALGDDRFCLYAQPIVPLLASAHLHYELLVRMVEENGEIIAPGRFMPAAERYGLTTELDKWVFSHACDFLAGNPEFLEQIDFVSINLSGSSLTREEFLDSVRQKFTECRQLPGKICFEITETVAISNMASATQFISALKEMGCRFALDDFGSGLSSFGYLKNLPVDYLKIDGMFVRDIVDDPIDFAMVKSINEIGQVMKMETIAEFVENDLIKAQLESIGVNFAQGFGVGKPEPLETLVNSQSPADLAVSK